MWKYQQKWVPAAGGRICLDAALCASDAAVCHWRSFICFVCSFRKSEPIKWVHPNTNIDKLPAQLWVWISFLWLVPRSLGVPVRKGNTISFLLVFLLLPSETLKTNNNNFLDFCGGHLALKPKALSNIISALLLSNNGWYEKEWVCTAAYWRIELEMWRNVDAELRKTFFHHSWQRKRF